MKRFTVSRAREQFADILTEADRTGAVIVERRNVQYIIKPLRPARRRPAARSIIETADPAVAAGEWQWTWTARGVRFGARARR